MDTDERLQETHKAALEAISELVAPLLDDEADEDAQEEARELIWQDPLSVETRSGWTAPGQTHEPEEYRLLLGTGGPAVQIVGDLDQWGEAETAYLEVQDWFKPWTRFVLSEGDAEAVLTYARQFHFTA